MNAAVLPVLLAALVLAPAPAQVPAAPPAAATATMVATDRYLFVIHDGLLLQFEIGTLQLLKSVPLPRSTPAGGLPPDSELVDEPVAMDPEVVEVAIAEPAAPQELADAVERGLSWLARHQDEDGRWDCDGFMKHDQSDSPSDGPGNPVHDIGVTGLALLTLLGDGNTLRAGRFKDNVVNAVRWLQDLQEENGMFGTNASHDFIYDHAIAAHAICEAYGLSKYKTLQKVAQRGVDYLESHRNPYAVWRYQPHDNDNDTSVTLWALLAYRSAIDHGLDVNANAMKLIATWFDQVTADNGRAGYTKAGEPSSRHPGDHVRFPPQAGEAMTAAALYGRFLLGQRPAEQPIIRRAAALLLKKPPKWDRDAGTIDAYYWCLATKALYQLGGEPWAEWSRHLPAEVAAHQRRDGDFDGSWDPVGVWDVDGGRIYATALCTQALQTALRPAKVVQPPRRRK